MRIKKYKQNEYLATESGIWVRNFTKIASPLDINKLFSEEEYKDVLANETHNIKLKLPYVDNGNSISNNVVIVSNGYDYLNKQKALLPLPYKDVSVLGVNGSLFSWKMVGQDLPASQKRMMNYYIINNPFVEAVNSIPTEHRYFPKCIASVRTNPNFLRRYEGPKYLYVAAHDEMFSGPANSQFQIDDYRNPVCAALCLAYKLKAKKIVLLCCDDSFKNERPGAVQLENKLWTYPQQIHSHSIIDGCIHWLKTKGINVKNCSGGPKYKNAEYINQEEMLNYFIG